MCFRGLGWRPNTTCQGLVATFRCSYTLYSVDTVLQDHLEVYLVQECIQPVSLYSQQRGLHRVRVGLQWFLNQTGDGATTHLESGAFLRSRAEVSHPDIQVTSPAPPGPRLSPLIGPLLPCPSY